MTIASENTYFEQNISKMVKPTFRRHWTGGSTGSGRGPLRLSAESADVAGAQPDSERVDIGRWSRSERRLVADPEQPGQVAVKVGLLDLGIGARKRLLDRLNTDLTGQNAAVLLIYLLESFIRRHVSEYKTCSKAPYNAVS